MELFVRWNARINLSAARTPEEVTLQVVDCLAIERYVQGRRVVDVGSGGGLPGLVLAIHRPEVEVVSIEPIHKKAAFQSAAVRELGLANVRVEARRVDPAVDTGFDTAVSRATFDLLEWLELGRRLVGPEGVVLGMEGREQRDLPEGAERLPYELGDRTRAIIRWRAGPVERP
ncbi:MAG: 16S rRNA (guanine(527)-N(7))-methyltransferase RsmG [Kofleriaceae bacterium]|nr:16S rRNA (guanine(527)-N(7))-methyltransferase RsmG [Kofleriaceae bacterium]MCL4224092.1 16S rRNA (guanine(527)-N(7))-methyltransferase RsmG [Myxococcales bacterium]